ncbi:MAG: ATP-binding protein [Pseudomonadota bacterium]
MGKAGQSAAFERAELMSVITEACDGADLAVLVTLLDTDPPQNLFWNTAAEKLLGCSAAEFQASSAWAWITPTEAAPAEATNEVHYASGVATPRPFETTIISASGQSIAVEVRHTRVQLKGRWLSVAFLFDISTERKAIPARMIEADRLAALGVLSAGIAHEINNPLAYLMLNLEYLSRELPTLPQDPHKLGALMVRVKDACHGAERVASIVRDLRTFVRADEVASGPADVRAALESALNIASNEIKQKATLIRDYETIPLVDASPHRIEQVLLNLLLNALQSLPAAATERHEIRARLRTSNGQVAITIEDTGTGIPEALLGKIFDPFFTTKPAGVGTGLGLPICRSIVRGLGGEISVCSTLGRGSAFTVTLAASTANQLALEPSHTREAPSPAPRRGRILIVDDEIPVARTLKALFQNEHDMTLASSGAQALEAIAAQVEPGFDVILCDLMMPGMSGMDLFEQIKRAHPGVERSMVFMTGGVALDHARDFLATSSNLTFEKPFDFDQLRQALRRLVAIAQRTSG